MRKDVLMALLSGFLACCGAIGGTCFSFHLQELHFFEDVTIQQQQKIIDKRISILQQCEKVHAYMPRVAQIMTNVVASNTAKWDVTNQPTISDNGSPSDAQRQEYFLLRADYVACVEDAFLFFGPHTRRIANVLSVVRIWYADPDQLLSMFDAMHDELLLL